MPRPYGTARVEIHAVPDNVEMLPPILDVLDDDALMLAGLVSVFLFAAFDDPEHLLIGQALVLVRIDADVMQRFRASRVACHGPHVLKRFVEVPRVRVADLDEPYLFVFSDCLEVVRSGPVAAADVALDDDGRPLSHFPMCQSLPDGPMGLQCRAGERRNHRLALAARDKPRIEMFRDLIEVHALPGQLKVQLE